MYTVYIWKEFEISEVTAPASQYILNYVGPQCSDPTRYGCQCYIDRIDFDDLKKQLFVLFPYYSPVYFLPAGRMLILERLTITCP